MIICFDLDNTLCHTNGSYESAIPKDGAKELLEELKYLGYTVLISTARGMGRTGNNPILASNLMIDLTMNQLLDWKFSYDELFIGLKPAADIYIDDKAINGLYFDQMKEALHAILSDGNTVQYSHCSRNCS